MSTILRILAVLFHSSSVSIEDYSGAYVRLLFIGDIFGRPGRTIVRERVPELVRERGVDLVIANAENSAAGFGLTAQIAEELFDLGIHVLTTGNHVWDKREIFDYFNMADGNPYSPARRVLRPANYPAGTAGWASIREQHGMACPMP
jgi:calcineurin-like phosphoesterase